jgi:hypothetical protein
MHDRCYSQNNPNYHRYGGRGITVCWKWHRDNSDGFKNFYEDMGPRPELKSKNGHSLFSIERKDNSFGYEPFNCVWGLAEVQAKNRDDNVWHTYSGETKIQEDWARQFGITSIKIRRYLERGKTFDWIAENYSNLRKISDTVFTYNGVTMRQKEWAKELVVSQSAVLFWIKKGKSFDWVYKHFMEIKENAIKITYLETTRTHYEWAAELGVRPDFIQYHLKNGKSFEYIIDRAIKNTQTEGLVK